MAISPVVHARVPAPELKKARKVLKETGLKMSDVVRSLIVRIANDGAVPPELFRPNATTLAAFKEAEERQGKSFATVDALFEDLNDPNA